MIESSLYRCQKCGSTDVEGTLPVWHSLNRPTPERTQVTAVTDFEYGRCNDCETRGPFAAVIAVGR